MNIVSSTALQPAINTASSAPPDAVEIMVLKKALDTQAAAAATLLQALPAIPILSSSGTLGTRVNTFA